VSARDVPIPPVTAILTASSLENNLGFMLVLGFTPVFPWRDRAGRLFPLKLGTFVALFLPAAWILWQWWNGDLLPKQVTEMIHQTGDWAVRLLMLSLFVTPLRRIANWNRLIALRRMIGVAALAYAVAHLSLYVVDQRFDLTRVASEIALRIYLTIGFVALLGLAALGITSTDAMIRRLGGKAWGRLHRIVYGLGALACLHYFMQSKIDATQATLIAGFFLYLMLFRLLPKLGLPVTPWTLFGLALASGLGTVAIEGAWYAFGTTAPWLRIMQANLAPDIMIRPAWYVLAAGLVLVLVNLARQTSPAREPLRTREKAATQG
jgi:sulfoxide reductase heme-binding subunit YedZ